MPNEIVSLFLQAYNEKKLSVRVHLALEAFWNNAENSDEVVASVEHAYAQMKRLPVPPLLPIMHCSKLLEALSALYQTSGSTLEMEQKWFVDALKSATGWGARRGGSRRVALKPIPTSIIATTIPFAQNEHIPLYDAEEFGFTAESAPNNQVGFIKSCLILVGWVTSKFVRFCVRVALLALENIGGAKIKNGLSSARSRKKKRVRTGSHAHLRLVT